MSEYIRKKVVGINGQRNRGKETEKKISGNLKQETENFKKES